MSSSPNEASEREAPAERRPVRRPRGWFVAAGAAGALGGAAYMVAWLLPSLAPYLAAGAIFIGVGIGALLARGSRNRALLETVGPAGEELAADHAFERGDIAEHYRRSLEDRNRAEAASAAKSRVLATVSHELRTPLSGIMGLSDLLLETSLTPEQETFAHAVRTSGELMLGLVDDVLDFSKIEAGRFDLEPAPTEIERHAEEAIELFAGRVEAKGLDLSAEIDPATPAVVPVDAARLRQVLINLIGNAVKFTAKGGVSLRIGPTETGLAFAVEDTGPGIAPALAPRLFNEFERAETEPGVRLAGSGLGLAISQRIVNRMGGEIVHADRPGGGSVFSFTLPLAAPRQSAPPQDLAGKRGLIVAPEGLAPAALARQLEAVGAVIGQSETIGRAAALAGAASAAGEGYDFVLLDNRLVHDTGAALATIREAAGSAVHAVILVPPGRRASADVIRASGFDAYLVRPVRRSSLIKIVEGLFAAEKRFAADPHDLPPPRLPKRRAGKGLRVLIAEDDEINALLLKSMLIRQGHEVTEVGDGSAAVIEAAGKHYDVAMIDLSLPGLNGLEAAAAIRSVERESSSAAMRLIAVTADARPEAMDEALAAGFNRFLRKPLTPMLLRDLLASLEAETRAA